MEKLDRFYEKINGSYFGIAAFVISVLFLTISQMLYIAEDPSFSITTNFISDLGARPNGADIAFSIGVIISGVLFIPFYLFLGRYLLKKGNNLSILIKGMYGGLIACIGSILVGVFPLDPDNKLLYNLHIIAAGLYFYGLLIMLMIYGISEIKIATIPNILGIFAIISAILLGAFITTLIFQYLTSTPFQTYTYITEWIGSWIMSVWIIANIYYTLKNK